MTQPRVAAIACTELFGGIGLTNGDLPWGKHKEDMNYFKELTRNSVCIMGRNTYNGIIKYAKPNGPLLKDRVCIVITNTPSALVEYYDGCNPIYTGLISTSNLDDYHTAHILPFKETYAVDSIEKAYKFAQYMTGIMQTLHWETPNSAWNNIFFIGGSQIYKACIPYIDTLFLNVIQRSYKSDVFFPNQDYNNVGFKMTDHARLPNDLSAFTYIKEV